MINLLLISLGAVAGAIARWLLGLWLNPIFTTFAFGTLIANWVGCLLIGIAMGLSLHDQQKLLIITGFLGSFTTFSSFSAELSEKLLTGKWLEFGLTLGLHLVGGILLTVLLQSTFSRKINLTPKQTAWVAPILAVGIVAPWFLTLHYLSIYTAYLYLVIFTVIEVYALTAMANLLVKFDNGTHRGFIFGASRLLLSIATVGVMNLVPHLFLV